MQNRLHRNTFITPCAILLVDFCSNYVKALIYTMPFAFVGTFTKVSDSGFRFTAREAYTSS